MPTYQYRCSDCGHEFDQYQKFTDSALTVCPSCNGAIRRVIQPVGVVFKGSGWYINDSKKSDNGSTSAPKKTESTEGSEKAEVAASAEPAAKAEKSEASDKPAKTEVKESAPAAKPSPASSVAAGS